MPVRKPKREALTVQRFINEVLISQLSIGPRQIVNDSTFKEYTDIKRPDLLISEFEFDTDHPNEKQFIENLVAYAELKDNCSVNDSDWNIAKKDGKSKAAKLGMPFFIVSNCKVSIFYNGLTGQEILLNGNPIREFQTIDIFRLIKNRLHIDPTLHNIKTNVDSLSVISETVFNKKLWELAGIYRAINFKDNQQKIDFTIGFIALEFFEEKEIQDGVKDNTKIYWSECDDKNDEKLLANLAAYIKRLKSETDFAEFDNLIEALETAINGNDKSGPIVNKEDVRAIYSVINSMSPLHGTGFDLFGAVYEMFASSKEKKDFGEYFTRRHYAHILSKLLLINERQYVESREFKLLDLACGTGGFLTESFKVLQNNYQLSSTYSSDAQDFLRKKCFWGIDVREENVQRTRLNMFLVGDGHTNMFPGNTLRRDFKEEKFDYIITNPPYGNGTVRAETTAMSTTRYEIAFLSKIIKLLRVGGRACIVVPDGVFENPSYEPFRKELLEKCDVEAVISIPKFAFAPYTKEKTYALFITKRGDKATRIQSEPIWMYIIDNDGLANSDKRFPTKLRNGRNGWKHDEISGWVSVDGDEMPGILEARWKKYDDLSTDGLEWVDEKGSRQKMHKGGFIDINKVNEDNFHNLLPEYYIRPYKPSYIKVRDLNKEVDNILTALHSVQATDSGDDGKYSGEEEQVVPLTKIFDLNQGHQITDLELYNTEGDIPVYTGNNDLKGHWNKAIIEEGDLPCLTYPTKANSGVIFIQHKIFDANNTAVLVPKDEWRDKIVLDWFRLKLPAIFLELMTSKEGVSYLNREIIETIEITLPSKEVQKKEVVSLARLETLKHQLEPALAQIEDLLGKELIFDND